MRISGTTESLEWKIRFKVAVGVAEGLQYLHQGCHRRIIHRDIKASNILLTQDYQPQVFLTFMYCFLFGTITSLWLHLCLADFWFWTCKVASRQMGSPCCLPYWRHIRVIAVQLQCSVLYFFFPLSCVLNIWGLSWTGFQVFGPRVFYAWDCWWKDRCFCIWGFIIRAHNRSSCSWFISTEPGDLGIVKLKWTLIKFAFDLCMLC